MTHPEFNHKRFLGKLALLAGSVYTLHSGQQLSDGSFFNLGTHVQEGQSLSLGGAGIAMLTASSMLVDSFASSEEARKMANLYINAVGFFVGLGFVPDNHTPEAFTIGMGTGIVNAARLYRGLSKLD